MVFSSISGLRSLDYPLLAVSSLSLGAAMITAIVVGQAHTYEISIYTAYPTYFWAFLIVSSASGIVVMVHNALLNIQQRTWFLGWIAVLASNSLVLLLPFFRGYWTFGYYDPLDNLGFMRSIVSSGRLASPGSVGEDFYPATHVIGVTLYYLTGIRLEMTLILVPFFFVLLYFIGVHVLARAICRTFGQALLVTAFGSLLLFANENLEFAPSVLTFYMLPIVLMSYFKLEHSRSRRTAVISSLFVLVMPIFDPADGVLFLVIFFAVVGLEPWIRTIISPPKDATRSTDVKPIKTKPLYLAMILLFAWFAWLSYFTVFGANIAIIVSSLLRGSSTYLSGVLTTYDFAHPSFWSLLQYAFSSFGQAVIYIGTSAILVVHFLRTKSIPVGNNSERHYFYSALFLVYLLIMVIFFFKNFYIDWTREMRYVIFSSTILNGLLFYEVWAKGAEPRRRLAKVTLFSVVTILLTVTAFIGLFNTFYSPIMSGYNEQVTRTQITGMSWLLHNEGSALPIASIWIRAIDFGEAIDGRTTFLVTNPNTSTANFLPPDHFGYASNAFYGQSYIQDHYYIQSIVSTEVYPLVFPSYGEVWRFTPNDFQRLTNDSSVELVYSNGGFISALVLAQEG